MKLALYREHLARELRDLPDFMSQDVQSYTLTTAILARRIDQRLGGAIKTLSIRERIGKNRRLSFIKLVNMLLHYPRFRPDITNSYVDKTVPGNFTVFVESDKSRDDQDYPHHVIRLADYFAIIEKIANDDIFVLKHLLSASIDRLRRASDTDGTIDSHHLEDALSSVDDVICLRRKLGTSARFSFGTIAMSAIIERRIHSMSDVERVSGTPFSDFEHFIGGYETAWTYSPFMPRR